MNITTAQIITTEAEYDNTNPTSYHTAMEQIESNQAHDTIVVRETEEGYVVVSGFYVLAAYQTLGITSVPVTLEDEQIDTDKEIIATLVDQLSEADILTFVFNVELNMLIAITDYDNMDYDVIEYADDMTAADIHQLMTTDGVGFEIW